MRHSQGRCSCMFMMLRWCEDFWNEDIHVLYVWNIVLNFFLHKTKCQKNFAFSGMTFRKISKVHLETWEKTRTLKMWPWSVWMVSSWKLTKWYYYSGDVDQLDEMVKSMMEKSQSKYADGHRKAHRCKVCGKEGKGNYIKYHIETNHIEGIVLPCNLCGKTFPSRKGLNSHKSNQHIKASQLFGLETFGSSQNGNMF